MKFFEAGGWYLPDGEEHLQEWMTKMQQMVGPVSGHRLGYQAHKYRAALPFVRGRRIALDIGAHVGLWSWPMSFDFAQVHAFEPMTEHRKCWVENMRDRPNATMHPFALGATYATVNLLTRTPGSSGDTGVDPAAERSSLRASVGAIGEKAQLRRLDSFGILEVDFVKIDCEGYEFFVLQGGVETLQRCRPCVIVEQKPETGMVERYGIGVKDGVHFLESIGAKVRAGIQGDYIMSWDE